MLLSASTGLRTGECKNLRWRDFRIETDEEGKRVLIVSVRAEISKVRRGRAAVAHSDNIIDVVDEYKKASLYSKDNDLVFGSLSAEMENSNLLIYQRSFAPF